MSQTQTLSEDLAGTLLRKYPASRWPPSAWMRHEASALVKFIRNPEIDAVIETLVRAHERELTRPDFNRALEARLEEVIATQIARGWVPKRSWCTPAAREAYLLREQRSIGFSSAERIHLEQISRTTGLSLSDVLRRGTWIAVFRPELRVERAIPVSNDPTISVPCRLPPYLTEAVDHLRGTVSFRAWLRQEILRVPREDMLREPQPIDWSPRGQV